LLRSAAGQAFLPRTVRPAAAAVTFIHRFSDALNLDPHLHTLALDGIYIEGGKGELVFRRIPPPSDAEVARVADRVHRRVATLMERRGLGPQADPEEDRLRHDEPLLAELYSASVSGRIGSGPRAGKCVVRVGDAVDADDDAQPARGRLVKVTDYSLSEGCMSEQANEQLVRNLYDAFGRGDIPTILNMLADDVDWYDPGPPAVTHAGRYRGREDVLRFFSRIGESLVIETFQPTEFLQ
jgi:SnoaL-like domain/Putative transposase